MHQSHTGLLRLVTLVAHDPRQRPPKFQLNFDGLANDGLVLLSQMGLHQSHKPSREQGYHTSCFSYAAFSVALAAASCNPATHTTAALHRTHLALLVATSNNLLNEVCDLSFVLTTEVIDACLATDNCLWCWSRRFAAATPVSHRQQLRGNHLVEGTLRDRSLRGLRFLLAARARTAFLGGVALLTFVLPLICEAHTTWSAAFVICR